MGIRQIDYGTRNHLKENQPLLACKLNEVLNKEGGMPLNKRRLRRLLDEISPITKNVRDIYACLSDYCDAKYFEEIVHLEVIYNRLINTVFKLLGFRNDLSQQSCWDTFESNGWIGKAEAKDSAIHCLESGIRKVLFGGEITILNDQSGEGYIIRFHLSQKTIDIFPCVLRDNEQEKDCLFQIPSHTASYVDIRKFFQGGCIEGLNFLEKILVILEGISREEEK